MHQAHYDSNDHLHGFIFVVVSMIRKDLQQARFICRLYRITGMGKTKMSSTVLFLPCPELQRQGKFRPRDDLEVKQTMKVRKKLHKIHVVGRTTGCQLICQRARPE